MRHDNQNGFRALMDAEQFEVTYVVAPAPDLNMGEDFNVEVLKDQMRNVILAPLIVHVNQKPAPKMPPAKDVSGGLLDLGAWGMWSIRQ